MKLQSDREKLDNERGAFESEKSSLAAERASIDTAKALLDAEKAQVLFYSLIRNTDGFFYFHLAYVFSFSSRRRRPHSR